MSASARKNATAPAPEKTRLITLHIMPSLVKQLDAIAAAEKRSRAAQINIFLERAVRDYRAAA
jgi:hypothetical protein